MPTTSYRRLAIALCTIAVTSSFAACASSPAKTTGASAPTRGKRQTDLITAEELTNGQWSSVYEAVRTLRPQWLNSKGPDTILGEPVEIQARLDDSPLGSIASLRQVNALGVSSIRWIDGITAAGRWGGAYAHGAVIVTNLKR